MNFLKTSHVFTRAFVHILNYSFYIRFYFRFFYLHVQCICLRILMTMAHIKQFQISALIFLHRKNDCSKLWISHELIERSCADSCCFFLLVRPILRAVVFANLYNCAMDLVENRHTFGKGIADCSSSQHAASLFWTLVVAPTLWMSVTAWCSAQKSVSGMLGLVMSLYNGPST